MAFGIIYSASCERLGCCFHGGSTTLKQDDGFTRASKFVGAGDTCRTTADNDYVAIKLSAARDLGSIFKHKF
jgi:hypothetical protein